MRIILLAFIILFASCLQNNKPILIIPKTKQDKVFSQFINPITDKYALLKLRETSLPINDLEIRVWFSAENIDGFILKRLDGNWSATSIKEIDCKRFSYYSKDKLYELGKTNFLTPKSDWESMRRKLFEAGILDLPNSEDVSFVDGSGYIVEINQNGKYRIYFYSNPNSQKTEEAKRMMTIGEIIADEFGLHNFKINSLCLEK